jgi:hypothetical protein
MFQLEKTEKDELVTICDRFAKWKQSSTCPYAFTENGAAMLSSVLNSETAVMVNVQIMRAFTRLRNLVADNSEVRKAIVNIEKVPNIHDRQIQIAFDALKSLLQPAPHDTGDMVTQVSSLSSVAGGGINTWWWFWLAGRAWWRA